MTKRTIKALTTAAGAAALAVLVAAPASSHHSFAMYDQSKVVTVTGVVERYVPQANHAEFHVIVLRADRRGLEMGKDGKPVKFGVEMAGTAQLERQGITAASYPQGTVISFKVNPLRDGSNFGARVGGMARCPTDPATKKPTLPAADKHCDSVAGHVLTGGTTF